MKTVPERVERIAVCVADFPSLGDQLALLPLFEGLRQRFPGCRILAASRHELIRLAADNGFVDETLLYRKADWQLLRAVRRFDPQVSICMRRRSTPSNAIFGRLSGARCTVGYRWGANALWHTALASFRENVYRPRRNLAALERLGGSGDLAGSVSRLAASSTRAADRRPYVVLVPCGAKDRKHWPVTRYAAVARELADRYPNLAWYAVLGPGEVKRGYRETFENASLPIETVANASINDLARILTHARLAIANDCGPAHLAQMAGVAAVHLFDNSDGLSRVAIPSWFDPRPRAVCLTPRRKAPIDRIPVEAVMGAAREVLDDPALEGAIRYL